MEGWVTLHLPGSSVWRGRIVSLRPHGNKNTCRRRVVWPVSPSQTHRSSFSSSETSDVPWRHYEPLYFTQSISPHVAAFFFPSTFKGIILENLLFFFFEPMSQRNHWTVCRTDAVIMQHKCILRVAWKPYKNSTHNFQEQYRQRWLYYRFHSKSSSFSSLHSLLLKFLSSYKVKGSIHPN